MDIFRSNHLHTKPSNFSLGHLVRTQCKIRRFCMEIIGPKNAHISAANCSKQLIFGEWAFFIMLFPNMQSHCIISQIHLFVTSHFTTLLANRLEKVLLQIIHANQNAFVKGRSIFDAVRTVDDIVDYTKRNRLPGILIAISDFEKAFDTSNFNFLIRTLHQFNFGHLLFSGYLCCMKMHPVL